MAGFSTPDRSRPVALWLFATAVVVFALVVVGGATRLTGSGLSITEWQPVMGVFPPSTDAAWADAFRKYQATTQYRDLNAGMSMAAFQSIYWWEWTHRLLGRLVGVVFAGPLVGFALLGRIPRRLIVRCLVLLALGGLQGLVGWWMVKSGLEGRVAVAPERLAIHLGLALVLYGALIWTALEAWFGPGRPIRPTLWRPAAVTLMLLVFVQCLLGALVAGNQAGLVDNDWPLMNGHAFPTDYWVAGWRSLLHGQAAVQFNHRLVAYAILALAAALAVGATRTRLLTPPARVLTWIVAGLVLTQVAMGIATLMAHAPLGMSEAHQALAAIVLAGATTLAWRNRRA
ncbi:MAG TPA: COX15/CtaA family protein [Caulobacteraceae bacterium]|nr:COX15/CtaA family protein [Caulobacteraceae bacterium]